MCKSDSSSHLTLLMSAAKKRKPIDLLEEEDRPKKKQRIDGTNENLEETDFKTFDPEQIYQWALDNNIARTPALFIKQYKPTELLAMTEDEVKQLPGRSKKRVSGIAAAALWNAISKVNNSTKTDTKHGATPSASVSTNMDNAQAVKKDKAEEKVLNWLRLVVNGKPKTPAVTDILPTIGARFPHCVPKETKQSLYRAAVSSHVATNYNKEMMEIPFINGSPGIGKTRMALESLNILKECATESTDPREDSLKQLLASNGCVMSYVSFGSGFALTEQDNVCFDFTDCSSLLVIRVLWRYYLKDKYPELCDVTITKAMAKYLTLKALINQLREVGVTYFVLTIDEMNMLYNIGVDKFRQVIASISNATLNNYKNFFVLFAGAIHTPLSTTITKFLGLPLSICPSLFTLADVYRILNEQFEYLKDWQLAGTFRRCIADLSNPPRVFDYIMMMIDSEMTLYTQRNVFTLDYAVIMKNALTKANKKQPKGLDPVDAKEILTLSLMKEPLSMEYRLASGKSLEEYVQAGYVFFTNVGVESEMRVAVPYFYLYHWLKSSNTIFATAESLFQFTWNDPTEIGPVSWEKFNVKFTSFKLTLLADGMKTIPFDKFHSGALFGEGCSKYTVTPRVVVPAAVINQFPACFKTDIMETELLTDLLPSSSRPKSYWTSVIKNAMNTTGIDAFYWLSEKVIEFQQYTANKLESKNPTNLTQQDIDDEYNKAKGLFDEYLAPFNYQFVFGLISNRALAGNVQLPPNMYLVHQGNMEEYYGPSFASVAQIKAFRSVNINTDDVPRLERLNGVSQQKALEIIAFRKEKPFQDLADLRARVKGIHHNQDHIVIEF